MKSSLHLLITIKPACSKILQFYTLLILSFILMILTKNSMEHSMTLNRADVVIAIVQPLSARSLLLFQGFKDLEQK